MQIPKIGDEVLENGLFTIGAFAIILDRQQRVLLCHRTDMDRWNLPGGGVLFGETPWQAVVREVREEVGLNVRPDKLLGIYAYPPKNDLVFSFLCTIIGGTISTSNEADLIDYFPLDHLPATTLAHHALRIQDLQEQPEQLHLKSLPDLAKEAFSV